jgi:hypothetical protein
MLVHAAGESSPGNLPESTHAVVLAVPDERALLREETRLRAAGASLTAIREPDAPFFGALMAIGLRPARKGVIRKLVSELPLLK